MLDTSTRFTLANTEGYAPADLDAMNRAFVAVCAAGDLPWHTDDIGVASLVDRIAEDILAAFDAGKRGEALIAAACQGRGAEGAQWIIENCPPDSRANTTGAASWPRHG